MLIDEEFDFLIASLALTRLLFALRAIASLALRARSQRAAWAVLLAQNCAGIILALRVCFLGSLCGAKLGFGGKPLL